MALRVRCDINCLSCRPLWTLRQYTNTRPFKHGGLKREEWFSLVIFLPIWVTSTTFLGKVPLAWGESEIYVQVSIRWITRQSDEGNQMSVNWGKSNISWAERNKTSVEESVHCINWNWWWFSLGSQIYFLRPGVGNRSRFLWLFKCSAAGGRLPLWLDIPLPIKRFHFSLFYLLFFALSPPKLPFI